MKCSPEQLSALLDGDLSPRVAARVRAHLETCERCRADEQALTAMRAGLASLPAPAPGADDGWLALTRKLGAQPQPARRWSWRRWVLAPVATPKYVVDKINTEVAALVKRPEIIERLHKQGIEEGSMSVDAFNKLLKDDYERMARVVKVSGAKAD